MPSAEHGEKSSETAAKSDRNGPPFLNFRTYATCPFMTVTLVRKERTNTGDRMRNAETATFSIALVPGLK